MVNENIDQFTKVARKHKSPYLDETQERGVNDAQYNNRQNTDKSPGTTGRKL